VKAPCACWWWTTRRTSSAVRQDPRGRMRRTTASDGARALSLVATGDFDVVVTDIRMPGAGGSRSWQR